MSTMSVMTHVLDVAGLLLAGVGVGAVGTLVGAGGGFILVPALILAQGMRSDLAAGTSLFVVLCNAASGAVSYARQRRIDYRSGVVFALLTIPGAVLGARVARLVVGRPFHILFGILLLLMAVQLWAAARRDAGRAATRGHAEAGAPRMDAEESTGSRTESAANAENRAPARGWLTSRDIPFVTSRRLVDREGQAHVWTFNMAVGAAISLVVGFASSVLGIGGGIIHVPALIQVLAFPARLATATSHFILVFTALAGVVAHTVQGTVDFRTALPLGVGSVLGAPLGAYLSQRVRARSILDLLALGLAMVALRLFTS